MSEADTERRKVTLTSKGKELAYYARELGYFEFQELEDKLEGMPSTTDAEKNRRGLALMKIVTVASIELEDGKAAFDEASLRRLHRDIARPLADAAMKAQGIDMDQIRKEAMEAEGNADRSEAADEGNG